jgi:PAS domain S-box-containing protein
MNMKMKILIVDDNSDNLDLLMILLKSENYEVVSADNGKDALDKLNSGKFELIISDILMPVMDGFQLCRACKKDPELAKICFVFYTATYIDDKDENLALSIGADKFIRKPQDPEILLNSIREIVEKFANNKTVPVVMAEQEEKEVLKLYSERLVAKLEKKNLDLEKEIGLRIATENKLKESEERFRNLFQNNISVMLLIEPDTGHIIDANQSAEGFYGWSHLQLISMKIQDINTLDQGTMAELGKAKLLKQTHFEFQHRKANGSICDVEVFSSKIDIQRKAYLHSIIHDITERKMAEEALQKSERQLTSIYDTVGDTIYHISVEPDGNYRFVSVNNAFCKVTGLIAEMIIGKSVENVISEPSLSMVLGKYRQAIDENSIVRWEETSDYPTGRLTGDVCVAPVFDNHGRCTHLVGSVHDITEHKKAEKEIKELNQTLEEKVAERTSQLVAVNKELESFSYSISHDLRAPLRAILGFSQILSNRHCSSLDEEGQQYMTYIVEASTRMEQLINDLLNYSRLGRKSINIHKVQLSLIIDNVYSDFKQKLKDIGAKFIVDKELPQISGDETLLRQIFTNLIDNAIKYRQVEVPLEIKIDFAHKNQSSILTVSDNGIGISEEYFEKIFNIFQRLHNDDQYSGTGIGLATVKKAVGLLNGTVGIKSVVGKGSTFFLKFPENKPN